MAKYNLRNLIKKHIQYREAKKQGYFKEIMSELSDKEIKAYVNETTLAFFDTIDVLAYLTDAEHLSKEAIKKITKEPEMLMGVMSEFKKFIDTFSKVANNETTIEGEQEDVKETNNDECKA